MIKQKTLKKVIQATGVGVHTGVKVFLTLRPAPVNTGVVFRRIDLDPVVEIPALSDYIGDTSLSTCLIKDNVRVSTIEHLLSAISGMGIDNMYIDLTASEVPIMDGSAAPFIFLLQSAGIEYQSAEKKFMRIKKVIEIKDGDRMVRVAPYNGFKVSFNINFDHPLFTESNQSSCIDFSTDSYAQDISRARTFGFLKDYEVIRSMNLALGASLDNAVVMDDFKIINEDGLRYPDECVKHKILDAIGDLYTLGYSVLGSFVGVKSGHELNRQITQKILQDKESYEIVTFKDEKELPIVFFPAEDVA